MGRRKSAVMKIKDRRKAGAMVFLFSLTYMVSYITRINYGAIISEMQTATGFSNELLSMALTGSSVTYGVGQIVSGMAGDRIAPKKLVLFGLLVTVLMNLLIPLCGNPLQMTFVWSINGFAQSFMWPPIVKIMAEVLSESDYKNAVAKVSYGSSAGTIAVYLISPLLIGAIGWKSVFAVSAVMGVVMMILWHKFAYDVDIKKTESDTCGSKNGIKMFFMPVMLCIMLMIVLQGILRDGVTTWMPTYIAETYNLSNEISILTGVILPIFGILCFTIATKLHTEKFRNPVSCAALFFVVGTFSAVALGVFSGVSAGVSVAMSAVLTGCMHGANLMLIGMIPNYFQNTGKVSTVSGVLNSCTYIGSAISVYGTVVLSERFGWGFTITVWIAVAAAAAVICIICRKSWLKMQRDILKFD